MSKSQLDLDWRIAIFKVLRAQGARAPLAYRIAFGGGSHV